MGSQVDGQKTPYGELIAAADAGGLILPVQAFLAHKSVSLHVQLCPVDYATLPAAHVCVFFGRGLLAECVLVVGGPLLAAAGLGYWGAGRGGHWGAAPFAAVVGNKLLHRQDCGVGPNLVLPRAVLSVMVSGRLSRVIRA